MFGIADCQLSGIFFWHEKCCFAFRVAPLDTLGVNVFGVWLDIIMVPKWRRYPRVSGGYFTAASVGR